MSAAAHRALRRFWNDERGGATIDFVPVFFALVIIVLLIFEIGMAYFMSIRTQKAAQLGARMAATLPPVQNAVPEFNVRSNSLGRLGEPCYNPNGASRCVNPGGPWICDGASLSNCDGGIFNLIVAEMRRSHPTLDYRSVRVSYIYRELGDAGGRFIPEIVVSVDPQAYEFVVFQLATYQRSYDGATGASSAGPYDIQTDPGRIYSGISASAYGEDMSFAPTLPSPPTATGS